MAQVLCTAFSVSMGTVGATNPIAPEGPDVPSIMQDPIAAPIWYAMETDLVKIFDANIGTDKTATKEHKTDSGMVSFSHESVMKDWNKIHKKSGSVLSKDEPEGADFYIKGVGDPSFLFTDIDDKIIDYLKEETFPSTVSPRLYAYIINLLIGKVPLVRGVCGDDEEAAILKILKVQSDENFFKIVLRVGLLGLDTGID